MFAVGDTVVERYTGTPRMKVVAVDGEAITCQWLTPDNVAVQRVIPAELLTLAPKRR